ncbi:LMBR1 domain-containing protein 2 [Desmophyllum pertusum]|uniref:LMBR1 domain-containing protein 2 n=1 Tax=Desmophyllum pertusum TaxID=174260 RepID=A0A9X0D446_9CNID|nr:LMBR1 domain-containing protein 2 [Desmophyllum pertusum]
MSRRKTQASQIHLTVRNPGAIYRSKFFPIFGGLFTGLPRYFHGVFFLSCSPTHMLEILLCEVKSKQRCMRMHCGMAAISSYLWILLIYVIVKPDLHLDGTYLKIIGITASNTWELLLLVFLMGYGLVECPRTTWKHARLEFQMAHAYFKISKLSVEREESEEQLTEVLEYVGHQKPFALQAPLLESNLSYHKKCPILPSPC